MPHLEHDTDTSRAGKAEGRLLCFQGESIWLNPTSPHLLLQGCMSHSPAHMHSKDGDLTKISPAQPLPLGCSTRALCPPRGCQGTGGSPAPTHCSAPWRWGAGTDPAHATGTQPPAMCHDPAVVHQAVNSNPTRSKPLASRQPLQALIRKASQFKTLHNLPTHIRLVQQRAHPGNMGLWAVRTA